MANSVLPSRAAMNQMARRLRNECGALVVLVIRPEDGTIYIDPTLTPHDVGLLIEKEIPTAVQYLADTRGKG